MIRTAIESRRESLTEAFVARIQRTFADLLLYTGATEGTLNRRRAYNGIDTHGMYQFVREAFACASAEQVSLATDKVDALAAKYTQATIDAWTDRVTAKVSELAEAEVAYVEGFDFRITGTRSGRKVEMRQGMILNVSKLGKLFNQFPARIRLDGKAISEAAYKKTFA